MRDAPFVIHRMAGYPFIRLSKGDPAAPYGQLASRVFDSEKLMQIFQFRGDVRGPGKQRERSKNALYPW